MCLVAIGKVQFPHGLRGWLNVRSYSSDSNILPSIAECFLCFPMTKEIGFFPRSISPSSYKVERVISKYNKFLIKFIGIDDRNHALAFKGSEICISRKNFPDLPDGEYYWIDLIGCDFYGEEHGNTIYIGLVKEVFDNGAHPLLRIVSNYPKELDRLNLKIERKEMVFEILVPFVSAYITSVDTGLRKIYSNWSIYF